jgi:hypothetical protein
VYRLLHEYCWGSEWVFVIRRSLLRSGLLQVVVICAEMLGRGFRRGQMFAVEHIEAWSGHGKCRSTASGFLFLQNRYRIVVHGVDEWHFYIAGSLTQLIWRRFDFCAHRCVARRRLRCRLWCAMKSSQRHLL